MPSSSLPAETNLSDFLLDAAARCPHDVCLETEHACYTYAQLARMAESVRIILRKALPQQLSVEQERPAYHSRRPDEHIILVVLDKGAECLASVHAVLMEGFCYTAFDTTEPVEKLYSWLEVVSPEVMFSSRQVLHKLQFNSELQASSLRIVDVPRAIERSECRGAGILPVPKRREGDLDRLAYVIFTSGSTGKPKAVMIEHRSAINTVRVWSQWTGLSKSDRKAEQASMAFDVHVIEIYTVFHKQASLVVVPDLVKKSGPDLLKWLARKRITTASMGISLLRTMSGAGADVSRAALPELRFLDVGGEALGQDVLEAWAPGRQLFNTYGPTEASVVTCGCEVKVGDVITIGWDFPTYKHVVLDPETFKPLAPGQRGMLYIFGVGVARGYFNDEAKTAAKFRDVPGYGRGYCSGDLAFLDPQDGRIHFCGRADWQVKMRGLRIELETLEEAACSAEAAGVQFCEARPIENNTKLALIASGPKIDVEVIKATAAKLGAGYVLHQVKVIDPSCWRFNSSSKLVRNHVRLEETSSEDAFAEAEQEAGNVEGSGSFVATDATPLELEIASCLGQLLGGTKAEWDRNTHFIEELGIDSAGFGKLLTVLRRQQTSFPELGLVDLGMLFQHPTVEKLAKQVLAKARAEAEEAASTRDYDEIPLPPLETSGRTVQRSAFDCCQQDMDVSLAMMLNKFNCDPFTPVVEVGSVSLSSVHILGMALNMQRLLRHGFRAHSEALEWHRQRQELMQDERATSMLHDGLDRLVILALPFGAEHLAASLAAVLENATICTLRPGLGAEEFQARIRLLKPAVIITSSNTENRGKINFAALSPSMLIDVSGCEAQVNDLPAFVRRRRQTEVEKSPSWLAFKAGTSLGGDLRTDTLSIAEVQQGMMKWQELLMLSPDSRVANLSTVDAAGRVSPGLLNLAILLGPAGCRLLVPGEAALEDRRKFWAGDISERDESIESARFVDGERENDNIKRWLRAAAPDVLSATTFQLQSLSESMTTKAYLKVISSVRRCYFLIEPLFDDPELARTVSAGRSVEVVCTGRGALPILHSRWENGDLIQRQRAPNSEAELVGTPKSTELPKLLGNLHIQGLRSVPGDKAASSSLTPARSSPAESSVAFRDVAPRLTKARTTLTLFSALSGYLLPASLSPESTEEGYADGAWPRLCFAVQSLLLFLNPIWSSAKLVVQFRFILPLMGQVPSPALMLPILFAIVLAESVINFSILLFCKWILIGRYQGGTYPIYGLYYLRHWLVEYAASSAGFGEDSADYDYRPARALLKNLQLRMLGADVALSAHITDRITGFDCVRVGPLAAVQSHLTAVNYVGKHMLVRHQDIGAGATIGAQSVVEAGATVSPGALVETLSTIPSGTIVCGRWAGAPGTRVADADKSRIPSEQTVRSHVCRCIFWIPAEVFLWVCEKLVSALLGMLGVASFAVLFLENVDFRHFSFHEFPRVLLIILPFAMAVSSVVQHLFWDIMTIIACRLLPKAKVPCDLSIFSVQAQIAALKLRMVSAVSSSLGDSALQAPFFRLCGARIGKGSAMAEQTMLPETVVVGRDCFFASANVLTSLSLDQGNLCIPTTTVLGDNVFLGNNNFVAEGLPSGSFAGHNTWLPTCPQEPAAFFGNPAMVFDRPDSKQQQNIESPFIEFLRECWYNFRTCLVDVFFWEALKSQENMLGFVIGRLLWPGYTAPWQFFLETLIFAGIAVIAWFAMTVPFSNYLHNGRTPLQNKENSCWVLSWNTKFKIRCGVWKPPFFLAGTEWTSTLIHLVGGHVGKRFFSPTNGDEMFGVYDACYVRIGDDVTLDYGAVIQNHSFEDHMLKFVPTTVGNSTSLLQNSCVACSDVGEDVTVRPGSVTWKGQILEAGKTYDGAPAYEVEVNDAFDMV